MDYIDLAVVGIPDMQAAASARQQAPRSARSFNEIGPIEPGATLPGTVVGSDADFAMAFLRRSVDRDGRQNR